MIPVFAASYTRRRSLLGGKVDNSYVTVTRSRIVAMDPSPKRCLADGAIATGVGKQWVLKR